MIAEAMAKEDRAQIKILRILRLIDCMAGWSYPKTVKEIFDLTRDNYKCSRTLYRDIQLLESMGIVNQAGSRSTFANGFGQPSYLYKINLSRSKRLQEVAIEVFTGGDA
jgi:predicted DNA-binding transcriptional regulator YafY